MRDREQQGFAQIVRDEHDRLAQAAGQGAEFALQFGARYRVESAEWLVHQQDWRVGGKGARDANALSLAAGQFVRTTVGEFARIESNEGQQLVNACGNPSRVPFFERGY